MAGGDRSLRTEQSSALWETGACDLNGKGESASATTTAEILGTKMEEAAPDLIRAHGEAAGASCDLNGKEESAAEAATAKIIRKKKEEVQDLMRARKRMHEEAKTVVTTTEGKNGTEEKKRKKVVKRMFPQAFIDLLMTKISKPIDIIPDDLLATYSERVRDIHVISMAIDKKLLEYDKAIINQYLELGYAIDETEVTDDEMEH